MVVDETKIFERLCHRNVVNVVESSQNNLHIFKHAKSCLSSVDKQRRSYYNIGGSTNKNRLLMQVELSRKAVRLRLLGKVSQLGEVSVDHDDLRVKITLAVWNEDAASLKICWIVLLVEPHSGLFTSANVLRSIENIGKVTGHGAPVDQT